VLISPENHLGVMAMMVLVVAGTLWLDRYTWVRKISVAAMVIIIPLILSNLGLIPREAPAYGFVTHYFVILAVPLLLFKADLKHIFSETGRTMIAFLVAAAGTVAGAVVAFFVVPLDLLGAQAGAAMTGGFIGGGMNFVAVSRAVELDTDPTLFSTVLGAETVAGLSYLMLLAAMPAFAWFRRWDEDKAADNEIHDDDVPQEAREGANLHDLAIALGLSLGICALSNWIASALGYPRFSILVITLLALIVANAAPKQMARLRGEADLGMFMMYVFFAAYGAGTNLVEMIRNAPLLLAFGFVVIAVHALVAFGGGRLLGFSAREVATASNACVLGPPTAAALARQQGWNDLVTPGILVGVFGYVIGNFVGVTIFALLS
jgi:uncharacterized membrane protein